MGHISSPLQSQLSLMYGTFPLIQQGRGNREEKWDPKPSHEQEGKQEAHNCISLRDPLRALLVERENKVWRTKGFLQVNLSDLNRMSTPLVLFQMYKNLIQYHVALRVELFFQQAVVCYNTPFHFEIAETEGQFFVSPSLKICTKIDVKKVIEKTIKYQAAHSSTIPGLKACLRIEWEQAQRTKTSPNYFPFLKGTHLENLDNSTVALPDFVNKIDTLIDGRSKSKTELRGDAIRLINQVAQAGLTPCDATRQFIHHMSVQLQTRPKQSKSLTLEKVEVIRLYIEQLSQIKALASIPDQYQAQHPFFDSLLDVNVRQEKKEDIPIIRSIVYKRKCEIIREAQFTEIRFKQSLINISQIENLRINIS